MCWETRTHGSYGSLHLVTGAAYQALKTLTLAVTGTDFFEQYADRLTTHYYLTLISDLVEIGCYHLDLSLRKKEKGEGEGAEEEA